MNTEQKKEYNRKYYLENKEKIKEQQKEYFKNNPEKFKIYRANYVKTEGGKKSLINRRIRYRLNNREKCLARDKLNNAIKSGNINKKSCERCGNKESQAHHSDYSKPLEVNWFCEICHKFIEGRLINMSILRKSKKGWVN